MNSFSYLEPVCCSMSSSNCCFLTCIQISQEADQVVWYSHLFQNFPQFIVIHTVKGFGIFNKAEVHDFLELSCFFYDQWTWATWSLVPLPFWKPGWASWSSWLVYYCNLAWRILSITLLAREIVQLCGILNILWYCVSLELEWKLTFSSLVATAEFSKFAGILCTALSQHHLLVFEIAQLELPSPPLALFEVIFPKAHLTLHSRISGSRWVITWSWLSGSWISFCIVLLCILATSSTPTPTFIFFFFS